MDYTARKRRHNLIYFMKNLKYQAENITDFSLLKSFRRPKQIGAGAEGNVYITQFTKKVHFRDNVVLKAINLEKKTLEKIDDTKNLHKQIIEKFALTSPMFIELIAGTLTNQLILQNICPHYSMNYYWDFTENYLVTMNEFANRNDFHTWAQSVHSEDVWFNALFQIMTGIIAMQKYFNMTHTDLHTQNILVYKVKSGGYWTYTIDNFKYYLPNLGFVFLIHDLGFAWIPDNLYVDWHLEQTMSFVTQHGRKYYDIASFIGYIHKTKSYKTPQRVKDFLKNYFTTDDLQYIFSKEYYTILLEDSSPSEKKYIKGKLQTYPNITTDYAGTGISLTNKLFAMFYDNKETSYKQRPSGDKLDAYSLDKEFDTSKLPRQFLHLLSK
jgi:hypothetical protein